MFIAMKTERIIQQLAYEYGLQQRGDQWVAFLTTQKVAPRHHPASAVVAPWISVA